MSSASQPLKLTDLTTFGNGPGAGASPVTRKPLTISDLEAFGQQQSAAPAPMQTISAEPEPTGIGDRVARWAQNVSDDLKHGTDITGIGTLMKKMGAHGLYSGQPEKIGDFMGSIPLGILRTTKGGGEIAGGKVAQGAKDAALGTLQTAEMPLNLLGGPEGGPAEAATNAIERTGTVIKTAGQKVAEMVPSAARAGQKFDEVAAAADDIPININGPGETALRIKDLADAGGSMPKVVRNFLQRVTDPDKGAMTFKEARDFYSNASRLSADETQRLTPIMRRQMAQFTSDLNQAIGQAADQGGKLSQYNSAMDEYHKAMRLRAIGDDVKDLVTSKAAKAVGSTAAGTVGAYGVRKLLE